MNEKVTDIKNELIKLNYNEEQLKQLAPIIKDTIKCTMQALNIPFVMPRSEQLNSFCLWYKTTDFNCEGNSPEDCVKEYLKTI